MEPESPPSENGIAYHDEESVTPSPRVTPSPTLSSCNEEEKSHDDAECHRLEEDRNGHTKTEIDSRSDVYDPTATVMEGRLKSRRALEAKLQSRRSAGFAAAVLRTAKVVKEPKEPKPKKKRGPRKKKAPEKIEPLQEPKKTLELAYAPGATTTLARIRDNFYPGRNTQMISKSMQLRVPGCFYNRMIKTFCNVAVVDTSQLNQAADEKKKTEKEEADENGH